MNNAWFLLTDLPLVCNILLKVSLLLAVAWALHLPLRNGNPYWRILLWRGLGAAVLVTPLLVLLAPGIRIALPASLTPATYAKPAQEPHSASGNPGGFDGPFARDPFLMDVPGSVRTNNAGVVSETADHEASISSALIEQLPGWSVIFGWLADGWPLALLAVWAAGIVLFAFRWLIAWLRLRRVVSDSVIADEPHQACLRRTARSLGCDGAVQLRITQDISGPLLAGIRRPVILVPATVILDAEPGELSAVLAHELTHLRNRDLAWMAYLRGLTVVFWWHPLIWLACRTHRQACEEVCDATAAGHVGGSEIYSRVLARLTLAALEPSPVLAGISMARPAELMQRLSRLRVRIDASRPGLQRVAPAGVLCALITIALSGLQLVVAAAPSDSPAAKPAVSPMPAVARSPQVRLPAMQAGTVRSRSKPPAASSEPAGPARVLHFPADRSLGIVLVQDADLQREITSFYHWTEDGVSDKWEELCAAKGDVTIPPGKRVHLRVERQGWVNLSPLAKLAPDDLYQLSFGGAGLTEERSEEWGVFHNESAGNAVMAHVARLTGLKILHLNMTTVNGRALRHVEGLRSLECLWLPRLTDDAGMTHVAKLTGLKRLYFKVSNITDKGMAHLRALQALEELDIGGERLTDAGLAHLKELPRLHYLILNGQTFTDAGMVHVRKIPSLRTFYLFRIKTIGDEGLAHLADMPTLERLSLIYNTMITDAGMAHVARMPALRQLDITHTNISDAGALHLQHMRPLERLQLPHAIEQDALVPLLARQQYLRNLWCGGSSNSTYDDEVLEQIGKMADLEWLLISGKQMTDAGMSYLTKCRKLKSLSLYRCPITNNGFAEIGKIESLVNLDIAFADLTTSGLKGLNNLRQLRELGLSDITPDEEYADLSGLVSLKSLRLGTRYKGETLRDEDLAFLPKLAELETLGVGMRGISDAGLAHVADLRRITRLTIGGEITDEGLDKLAGLKQLNNLNIAGDLTDKGVLKLRQHPSLAYLLVITPNRLSNNIGQKLGAELPLLLFFHHGPDLQRMRPAGFAHRTAGQP